MNLYKYRVIGKYINVSEKSLLIINEKQFKRRKKKLRTIKTAGEKENKVYHCESLNVNTFKKGEEFLINSYLKTELNQGKVEDLNPGDTAKLHPAPDLKPSKFVKGGLGQHFQKLQTEKLKAETELQEPGELKQGKIEVSEPEPEPEADEEKAPDVVKDEDVVQEKKSAKDQPKPVYFPEKKGKGKR